MASCHYQFGDIAPHILMQYVCHVRLEYTMHATQYRSLIKCNSQNMKVSLEIYRVIGSAMGICVSLFLSRACTQCAVINSNDVALGACSVIQCRM